MCGWKNISGWGKELIGLVISGFIIILFMCMVVSDLRRYGETAPVDTSNSGFTLSYSNSNLGNQPSPVVGHTFGQVSVMSTDNLSTDHQHHYVMSAGPVGELIPFLDRLSFIDILILVFIWPVGVIFNKFARNLSEHLYDKYFK